MCKCRKISKWEKRVSREGRGKREKRERRMNFIRKMYLCSVNIYTLDCTSANIRVRRIRNSFSSHCYLLSRSSPSSFLYSPKRARFFSSSPASNNLASSTCNGHWGVIMRNESNRCGFNGSANAIHFYAIQRESHYRDIAAWHVIFPGSFLSQFLHGNRVRLGIKSRAAAT
ncbi:hypothetical protein PUN28_013301 [Cardiocondyla obscurior]|uniref:Uncharacterized protein n=1 Tax=Cardiocondyla obscurior TaxID=286306 RepID=A0AAW2FBU8_9HYME